MNTTTAISVLCPELGPPSSPIAADILRNCFSFLVRQRMFAEALLLSKDMIRVFQAAELESAVFKVLASVTVIQLALGDAVQVIIAIESVVLVILFLLLDLLGHTLGTLSILALPNLIL